MWMIKFQERSSKNHVIHKVNFMVITKVIRLMLPNILQSEHDIFGILVKLPVHQYQFYEYWVTHSGDMRFQRLATAPVFAEILKVCGALSSKPLVRLASNFGFGAVGSQITCIPNFIKIRVGRV